MELDLKMATCLGETLTKHNEDLTRELTEANGRLEKFKKSSSMLDEKIQSQRMKIDTSGIGFNTSEKGESSGNKSNMHKGKTAPKANNPTNKKAFKLVFFICHKPGHTANACRSRPNESTCYNANTRYVRFEGHCFTCNMYGHRSIECRYGEKNLAPHMNPRPNGDWRRTYENWGNMNWQKPHVNWFSPFEMEKVTNVICTICNNYGHVDMNYRRRTGRGNAGPWRSFGMTFYHCHKPGHMTKFCRTRKNKLVNHSEDQKGKHKDIVEETREEMNKI